MVTIDINWVSDVVLRHNNQPIVGGSDRRDDGEDAQPGWSV